MHRTGVLVISDGGLSSLVCVALACAQAGHVQTHVWEASDSGEHRRAAARSAAAALGCTIVDRRRWATYAHAGLTTPAGWADSVRLLSAAGLAAELGLGRVLWPVHFGDLSGSSAALDAAAEAVERAMLVSQLAMIDGGRSTGGAAGGGARIETPLVDLDDEQVLELALDLNAPIRAMPASADAAEVVGRGSGSGDGGGGWGYCWWECTASDPAPQACGRCTACVRWAAAAQRVDPRGRLAGLLVPQKPAA